VQEALLGAYRRQRMEQSHRKTDAREYLSEHTQTHSHPPADYHREEGALSEGYAAHERTNANAGARYAQGQALQRQELRSPNSNAHARMRKAALSSSGTRGDVGDVHGVRRPAELKDFADLAPAVAAEESPSNHTTPRAVSKKQAFVPRAMLQDHPARVPMFQLEAEDGRSAAAASFARTKLKASPPSGDAGRRQQLEGRSEWDEKDQMSAGVVGSESTGAIPRTNGPSKESPYAKGPSKALPSGREFDHQQQQQQQQHQQQQVEREKPPSKTKRRPLLPKVAGNQPMVCTYAACPNPTHTSGGSWKFVTTETRAGNRDWSNFIGRYQPHALCP
jgi:hypothetical protein